MPPSTTAAELRRRAEAELRALGADNEHRPMLAKISRRVATQLRTQKKEHLATPKSPADPQRMLHELQVHQIELEMQNAELHEARVRMEALLEKYTDLYDFAPGGYFSLDELGVVLEVNLTGAALLGVERSRLITRRLQNFVAPASRPEFLAFLKNVFTKPGKHAYETSLLMEDGSLIWADLQAVAAISPDSQRPWCRVTFSDITPLKQAEEKLHRSEALFATLIEQAPVGVYVVDERLRLQQVNPRALPIFSKVHPLIGRDLSQIMRILWPQKIADEIMAHFRHTLQTGKAYISPEFSERRHDTGAKESYEWQLQRITLPAGQHGVVCFFTDITERKHAEAVQRRVEVLAASNKKLELEIVRRQAGEKSLKKSERHLSRSLVQSRHQQEQLRQLARQILLAQEEERKRISCELHDEIAQTLVGMNLHLESLAREDTVNRADFKQKIARTQELIESSLNVVHRFARDLRPTLLDDMGLLPALHSYLNEFTERTKVRIHFKAFAGVERLSSYRRTVLYRVAQSALTNIAQHAHATDVKVSITKVRHIACLEIHDNGKSFDVERVLFAKRYKRLGLIGTRERVEMIGGTFSVESSPGKGTTIRAQIPYSPSGKSGKDSLKTKPA